MPSNLSGNVTIKFDYASRGILSLNGFTVDPGYGSDEEDEEGSRLHFILANVGSEDVTFEPKYHRLASIQFLPVIGFEDSHDSPLKVARVPSRIDELFSEDHLSLGLTFFKEQSVLEDRVGKLEFQWDKEIKSMDNVVYFGHFLLGTAILGLVLTIMFGLMSRMQPTLNLISKNLVPSIIVMSFIVIVLLGGGYMIARGFRRRK